MTLTLDDGMVALCSTAVAGGRKESRKKQREKATAGGFKFVRPQPTTRLGRILHASLLSLFLRGDYILNLFRWSDSATPAPGMSASFCFSCPGPSLGFHEKTRKVRWGLRQGKGT